MWDTISDSLDQFGASSVVDILFIAKPLLRETETRLFRGGGGHTSRWPWPGRALYEGVVDTVGDAALELGEMRHGAIILIERETGLEDYIDTRVKIDATVSVPLIRAVFYPNSALHDGAVGIREDRVVGAGC